MNLLPYFSTSLIFVGKILNRWSYSFRHFGEILPFINPWMVCLEWNTRRNISKSSPLLAVCAGVNLWPKWRMNSTLKQPGCPPLLLQKCLQKLGSQMPANSSINTRSYPCWKLGESSHTTSFAYSSDSIYQASSHLGHESMTQTDVRKYFKKLMSLNHYTPPDVRELSRFFRDKTPVLIHLLRTN